MRRSLLKGLSQGLIGGAEALKRKKAEDIIRENLEKKKQDAIRKAQLDQDRAWRKKQIADSEKADKREATEKEKDNKYALDQIDKQNDFEMSEKKADNALKRKKDFEKFKDSNEKKKNINPEFEEMEYSELSKRIRDLEDEAYLMSKIQDPTTKEWVDRNMSATERIRFNNIQKSIKKAKTVWDSRNKVKQPIRINGYEKAGR